MPLLPELEIAESVVQIPAGAVSLSGSLCIPEDARGIVLFAHGSGSSRHSPRNRAVARELHEGQLATLLLDLLTGSEEIEDNLHSHLRCDIPLLAQRLTAAIDWLGQRAQTAGLPLGLFGASTGAAAALKAASLRRERVKAIVCRSGRFESIGSGAAEFPFVTMPTLLVVGGRDLAAISGNCRAMEQLNCQRQMEIILGATHLFPERGCLDEVARMAREWFEEQL